MDAVNETAVQVRARSARVAHVDDLPVGTPRMARVDGQRICVVRTASGVHAIDNTCPHEGYGLAQGSVDGDVLTCQWHNWKFRLTDGVCVGGEEDVVRHHVDVADDGGVVVTLHEPEPEVRRASLRASLRRGIERDYVGQISRDVVRLLQASEHPGELVWEAVAHGAPRHEFGWGHSIAAATDCLAMVDLHDGDQRALPIVQAIAGIAEVHRDRPVQPRQRGPLAPRASAGTLDGAPGAVLRVPGPLDGPARVAHDHCAAGGADRLRPRPAERTAGRRRGVSPRRPREDGPRHGGR